MKQKTEIEMLKEERATIARAAIQLKHRLIAKREINDKVPGLLAEFESSLSDGRVKQLNIGLEDLLSEINP